MEFIQYVRKPFVVEAVQITEDNIEEVAELIGKMRVNEGTEQPFISLDRRIIPNVGRAYVGWWLTRLGDNYRCYAPKVFNDQVMQDEIAATEIPQPANGAEVKNVFAVVDTPSHISANAD